MRVPHPQEAGRLLEVADPGFRAFVALCAFAGLRLGETAAVQAGDLDFDRHQLTVSRQVQRAGGGQVEIRPPKYGSDRVVQLPEELCDLLRAHLRDHLRGGVPERWLFQGEPGDPPHQNTVSYWWRKTRVAARLDDLRLHDLRHFYASGLIAAGCDVVTVQRSLGHSSPTVTLQTYAHLWPTAADRTRSAAADLMRQSTVGVEVFADHVRTRRPGIGLQGPDLLG